MKGICITAATAMMALAAVTGACGGGGSKSATPSGSATGAASTASNKTGTPAASGTARSATPTPTTVPTVSAADADATNAASLATDTALAGQDIRGGDPNATPEIVSTIPPVQPRSGTTPVVDSTQIAPPNPDSSEVAFFVDMDASTPGIQSSRDVNPGDVFQVGIDLVGVPPVQNNIGGLNSFNFTLNYDKTKIVAPTYSGGLATNRNPKLNLPALGGETAGWQCLPGPEGDLDDPGGISGDAKPETGQAFLSCFKSDAPSSGTLVLATISFTAVASGSTQLTLKDVAAADGLATEFAHCPGDDINAIVPCAAGNVNVK